MLKFLWRNLARPISWATESPKPRPCRTPNLTARLRKSAVSIASQIACGKERGSANEFIQFLGAAKSSAAELRTQLAITREIGYLSEGDFLDFEDKINRISAMIGGLIRAIRKRKESQK